MRDADLTQKQQVKVRIFQIFIMLVIMTCLASFFMSCKTPTTSTVPAPVPTATPKIDKIAELYKIVDVSQCSKYQWKNRGKATLSYLRGMAASYSCAYKQVLDLGDISHDALAWYGKEASLVNTYTLLIGLGMRESSGSSCCGRDATATNVESDSAEAGMFQTSWNSHTVDSILFLIFAQYRDLKGDCLTDVFLPGIKCGKDDLKNWGTDLQGLKFQEMSKSCPGFAVDYAAYGIRVLRKHWGPLNRKEAEFNEDCKKMLLEVDKLGCVR